VKAKNTDFIAKAAGAARAASIFFFCGPDEAGASEAVSTIIGHMGDVGERVEMFGADLRRDPVLLGDEARSTSLFGEKRHILVRASGEEALSSLQNLTEAIDTEGAQPCPVFIVATGATDKSRSAKLLEKRKDALVALFHPPELTAVRAAVRQMADAEGVRLKGEMADDIARAAALDLRLARSEVVKLATYLDASPQSPKSAEPNDLAAIGAPREDDAFMPVVNAVLSGNGARVAEEIARMRALSLNPVGLLLAFERRAGQIAQIVAKAGPRGDIGQVVKAEQAAHRVFWKDARDLIEQARCWPAPRMERLTAKLAALHRDLMANNQGAEVLLAQGLAQIAREAGRRRR
jgi:DNA polymerase-3 subunit delta